MIVGNTDVGRVDTGEINRQPNTISVLGKFGVGGKFLAGYPYLLYLACVLLSLLVHKAPQLFEGLLSATAWMVHHCLKHVFHNGIVVVA